MRNILLAFVLVLGTSATAPFNVSLMDPSRNRIVTATLCLPEAPTDKLVPLYVFAHGGGLYPDDYEYLCGGSGEGRLDGMVARLVTPAGDSGMDLRDMAGDLAFLTSALPEQARNMTSPLSGHSVAQVILSGHSMGGAAALMAAGMVRDRAGSAGLGGVGVMAPGFWGPDQSDLLKHLKVGLCSQPLFLVVGDQDCANSLDAQARSIWGNITADCTAEHGPHRALVLLKGATHCQWPTAKIGSCTFDVPCIPPRLDRAIQQRRGMELLMALANKRLTKTLSASSDLSYVTEMSSPADLAKLHSYCPCSNSSSVLV